MSLLTNTCPAETNAHKTETKTGASPAGIPQNGSPHVLENAGATTVFLAVSIAPVAGGLCCACRGKNRRARSGGSHRFTAAEVLDSARAHLMKELTLSTVFPNRPASDPAMSRAPILGQQRDAVLCPTAPAAPPQITTAPRRKSKTSRQLTPQKIGVAWEKVRRVVRDLCRQRGPECLLCSLYGSRIEFQLTAVHRPISLDLDGHRIVARIERRQWTIRIVRIKTGGSGYELRRKIHTATSMLIELLLESRR